MDQPTHETLEQEVLNHKVAIQKIETNVALLLQKFNELEFPQRTGTQAIAPVTPVSPQAPTAQPIKTRIKPGLPPAYDGDRAFLTSIFLYVSLTGDGLQDEQARIHWALSYFKSGPAATFRHLLPKPTYSQHVHR